MAKIGSSPAEIRSIVAANIGNSNKKRKFLDEQPNMPLLKQICRDRSPECYSSSDSSMEPNKAGRDEFSRAAESSPSLTLDSNCFDCSTDSAMMYTEYESKSDNQQTYASDEPSTSTLSWGGATASEINLYSSDSRSMTKSGSTEIESLSISKQPNCPGHQCALHPSLNYEEYNVEVESLADCTCSEYRNDDYAQCMDRELENLLCSSGIDPSNYVLSSGRWSVGQDDQKGGEKLTIDKEFEQYFSTLML